VMVIGRLVVMSEDEEVEGLGQGMASGQAVRSRVGKWSRALEWEREGFALVVTAILNRIGHLSTY
jgi:hypothetical protein